MLPILAVLALATPAPTPQQFDLDCAGKIRVYTYKTGREHIETKPSGHVHLRFDLATQQFCGGACTTLSKLEELTDNDIVITKSDGSFASRDDRINRRSGIRTMSLNLMGGHPNVDSKVISTDVCTKLPFSGFSERRF